VVFDVNEGRRVAIARLRFEGNAHFRAKTLAGEMKTRPEGFWWFRGGAYDDDKLRTDLTERLPKFYGERGYVDFQVLDDTLIVNDTTGKATLVVKVSEGEPYKIGGVEIVGNRRFSTEDVQRFNPFPTLSGAKAAVFNQDKWDDATNKLRTLYWNNGYIYSNVRADVTRRTGPDGKPMVDLRWVITEGQPAIVNKIEIAGNDVTHERVIRDAIVLLPGTSATWASSSSRCRSPTPNPPTIRATSTSSSASPRSARAT
jgi:outer membrane protein insertion porin family